MQLCYQPSVVVYTILLRIYGQVGKIQLAEQIFLEMLEAGCEPDEVACGTMLCAYAKWGRHKDMLLFYSAVRRRDIAPPVAVYNFMLSSLQKQKLHEKVIKVWEQMLEVGVKPNGFTFTVAIGSYVKEELINDALDAFAKMRKSGFIPEEVTYNLLINLTAKHGKGDEALRLYEEMKLQGIVPSNYTFASILALHCKNNDYSKAFSLFKDMDRNSIVPDEVTYGMLVRIYGKLGLYEDAQKTFRDIEKLGLLSNEKTYWAMAQVHLNAGNYDKDLDIFDSMKSRGFEFSEFAYRTLLRCFIAKGDLGSSEITFQALSRFGPPDARCCNSLLTLYNKSVSVDKAKSLISHKRKDKVQFDEDLYKTVIETFPRQGMVNEMEEMIEEMENVGWTLDKNTMKSLVVMYGEAGAPKKAEYLLNTLEKPDANSFGVMLCLYLESGNTCKSKEILNSLFKSTTGLSVSSRLISKFVREGKHLQFVWLHALFLGTCTEEWISPFPFLPFTSFQRSSGNSFVCISL